MLVQVFLWFMFFLSLGFFMVDSILLIGAYSLLFSLVTCCLVSIFFSSWFGAIVVIVYVGGLLVMFSYFLAVFPNQEIESKAYYLVVLMGFSVGLSVVGFKVFYCPVKMGGLGAVDYFFSLDSGALLIFFIVFLLLCLFCVVSIVRLSDGPLRPFGAN